MKFGSGLWVLVGFAGGFGAILRYLMTQITSHYHSAWIIWFINILGSLGIGLAYGALRQKQLISEELYLILGTGFMGGFTTFSALSLDLFLFLRDGRIFIAGLLAVASIVAGIFSTFVGIWLTRA